MTAARRTRLDDPPEGDRQSVPAGNGQATGRIAVLTALVANVAIALAKAAAAAVTGSSAMLAEAIHSVADSVNEVLLLVGARRASRPADLRHPFGHTRYRFLYAFVVSLAVFWIGGVLSVIEGISHLLVGEAASADVVAAIRDAVGRTEGIDGIRDLRTIHIGPEDLVVAASVWVDPRSSATEISRSIDEAAGRVRDVVPFRTIVTIEPRVRDAEPESETCDPAG